MNKNYYQFFNVDKLFTVESAVEEVFRGLLPSKYSLFQGSYVKQSSKCDFLSRVYEIIACKGGIRVDVMAVFKSWRFPDKSGSGGCVQDKVPGQPFIVSLFPGLSFVSFQSFVDGSSLTRGKRRMANRRVLRRNLNRCFPGSCLEMLSCNVAYNVWLLF